MCIKKKNKTYTYITATLLLREMARIGGYRFDARIKNKKERKKKKS